MTAGTGKNTAAGVSSALGQNGGLADWTDYHCQKARTLLRARISGPYVDHAVRLIEHFAFAQCSRLASLDVQLQRALQNVSEHRTRMSVRAGFHARRH